MSVGAYTYAAVTDVQRLIGDIVANRTFAADTVPTITQCENELDNVAAEINASLDMAGYTVMISSTDYPHAYSLAVAANAYGAAARLLSTIPSQVYNPDEEITDTGESRPQQYEKLLNRFIKRVESHKLRAGMRKRRFESIFAGSQEDDDGYTKKPFFTRGMDSYPGRQSLTTEETD